MLLFLLPTSCALLEPRYFNIYLDNDTSQRIYAPQAISEIDQYLIIHSEDFPLRAKSSTNAHAIPVRSIPKEMRVRWKNELQGQWVERRIAIREVLGSRFNGIAFVSILEDTSLALSWLKRDGKMRTIGCGGYIFDTYYERARPQIERNISRWQAYLKKKEADLAAGITEPYKKETYYDRMDETTFRCSFLAYLQE
jgi:hypothetical protein